jgi:hypothetical protein
VAWVTRDVMDDLNAAAGRRWRDLDPMLGVPGDPLEGCPVPLVVAGDNGRPAGLGVCRHRHVIADALEQVWGAATRFVLTPRLREPDAYPALDELLGQWRDHLAGLPLDARGISIKLLHYAQLNPLSGPFWSWMGYRPLRTGFQSRPAVALR